MTFDVFRRVKFNDGEIVTHADLEDMQTYLEAKIWDEIIHNSVGGINGVVSSSISGLRDVEFGGQDGTDHPTPFAYCLNVGAGYLRQGATVDKIQVAPGTLCQKIGNVDGNGTKMLAYRFSGTETWTLTNGDASNPRVDLLQMQMTLADDDPQTRSFSSTLGVITAPTISKKTRVNCVMTVKVGTPAASPLIPDPDSGFCAVGAVMVGKGYVAASGNPTTPGFISIGDDGSVAATADGLQTAVVYDLRMPIRVRSVAVDPVLFKLVSGWTLNADKTSILSTSGVNSYSVICPTNIGRLLAVGFASDTGFPAVATTIKLGTMAMGSLTFGFLKRHNVPIPALAASNDFFLTVTLSTFENNHNPARGPTIQRSTVNKIGVPLWASGQHAPMEQSRLIGGTTTGATGTDNALTLQITNFTNASNMYRVIFYIAEGW